MKRLLLIALIIRYGIGSFAQSGNKSLNSCRHPENFKKENLVVWCIVPFDAVNRSPEERAEMLVELGLKHVAYDWRERHVAEFEEEIIQYQKHDLDYFAFWGSHDKAFELFKQYQIHPQIWITNPSQKTGTQEEKIEQVAEILIPLAKKASAIGSKLGLYNHGGWGGEPENLVAVCKYLKSKGHENVGIVYNFHHAHENIKTFKKDFEQMKPFLLCLNLNGMADPELVNEETHENMILPLGTGKNEAEMIRIVIESGYDGPVGIIGHIETQDVALSLTNNLNGLKKILEK
ncbi:MAG: hypothetical protein KAS71_11945 [Bacteroidales bacterium]|nr:hypothetical protein [Bacteroidales bacterium]